MGALQASGRFDAQKLGDRWLCLDCYAGCGSCCSAEFGQQDCP
jgi:hypothetical protein